MGFNSGFKGLISHDGEIGCHARVLILFTIRGVPESNLSPQIGCPDVQYFLRSFQADVNLNTLS